ncbi:MAG: hypothetical protein NZM25_05650 [Leptospiraceae bacterium]|nr:hypothetical protein [Leptospiraceae bacterium]MDW8306531.1 hypothetical protein [Leptospiraceae bacterium]
MFLTTSASKVSFFFLLIDLFAGSHGQKAPNPETSSFSHKNHSITSVAFLPLKNETDLVRLGEIELKFPVEAIKVLQRTNKKLKILAPADCLRLFKDKNTSYEDLLEKNQYVELARLLDVDGLISGKIKKFSLGIVHLELSIYSHLTHDYFIMRFEEALEKILPTSVAKVVQFLANYLGGDGLYQTKSLEPKSRIALLSNLDPLSLNELAMHLGEKDLKTSNFLYTTLSPLSKEAVSTFWSISTVDFSLTEMTETSDGILSFFPLENALQKWQDYQNEASPIFSGDREVVIFRQLARSINADYLLIFYYEPGHTFARGIDLRNGELTYLRRRSISLLTTHGEIFKTTIEEWLLEPKLPDVSDIGGITALSREGRGSELATVAILDFFNLTKKKEFQYLRTSLSSAVSESMLRIFEFRRADRFKEIAGEKFLEKARPDDNLSQLFQLTGADFLIYGNFTYNSREKLLHMEARIYDLFNQKEVGRVFEKSPIDSRIFNAVDNIAEKLVQLLYKMATQQQGG